MVSGGPGRPPLSGRSVARGLRNKLRKQKNDFLIYKARRVDTVSKYHKNTVFFKRYAKEKDIFVKFQEDELAKIIVQARAYRQLNIKVKSPRFLSCHCKLDFLHLYSSLASVTKPL